MLLQIRGLGIFKRMGFITVEHKHETCGIVKKLTLKRAYSGDRCKLTLAGELRHDNSEELYTEVVQLFDSGVTDLILDFLTLEYVDTAGLQSLVRIYKHVSDKDNLQFKVLTCKGELLEILKTCRFDKFINITQDTAVADGNWQQEPV